MLVKKLFISLSILGAVGGSGAGIYYSLKSDNSVTSSVPSSSSESVEVSRTVDTELDSEKVQEENPKLNVVDSSGNGNPQLPSVQTDGDSSKSSASERTSPPQVEPLTVGSLSVGVVSSTSNEGEDTPPETREAPTTVNSGVAVQTKSVSDSGSGDLPGTNTSEEEAQKAQELARQAEETRKAAEAAQQAEAQAA